MKYLPRVGFLRRGRDFESKNFFPGQRLLLTGIRKPASPQRRASQIATRRHAQARPDTAQFSQDRSANPPPRFGGLAPRRSPVSFQLRQRAREANLPRRRRARAYLHVLWRAKLFEIRAPNRDSESFARVLADVAAGVAYARAGGSADRSFHGLRRHHSGLQREGLVTREKCLLRYDCAAPARKNEQDLNCSRGDQRC